MVTTLPANEGDVGKVDSAPGSDHLEEETATHPNIPAWETPRTEEPGGLQSMGSQRVGLD